MICAWNSLLGSLPQWMREDVNLLGSRELEALRLRINAPPELVLRRGSRFLQQQTKQDDLNFIVNHGSRFSPWASESLSKGYLTISGGHRIGICGEAVVKEGRVTGFRQIRSLCVRVARDFRDIGSAVLGAKGSVLILGAPGWGKTTLLRDMIRILSEREYVSVVDERGEVFPEGFPQGKRTDILTGASKPEGMEMVLRTMGPDRIAVDEITSPEDCAAILRTHGCGVKLIATAHAASLDDYCRRSVYKPLISAGVFETCFLLHPDKHCTMERILS